MTTHCASGHFFFFSMALKCSKQSEGFHIDFWPKILTPHTERSVTLSQSLTKPWLWDFAAHRSKPLPLNRPLFQVQSPGLDAASPPLRERLGVFRQCFFCTCLGQRGQVPKHLEGHARKKPVGVCAETPACDWRARAVVAKQSSSSCAKSELLVGSKEKRQNRQALTHTDFYGALVQSLSIHMVGPVVAKGGE